MPSPVIDATIQAMTNANTVLDAAIIYVADVPRLLQQAVDAAMNNGATAAQLEPVSALGTTLTAKADALVQAMAANTPSPPPTPVQLAKAKGKP